MRDSSVAIRWVIWCGVVLLIGAIAGIGLTGGYKPTEVQAQVSAATGDAGASPFVKVAEDVLPGVVSVEAKRWIQHPVVSGGTDDEDPPPGGDGTPLVPFDINGELAVPSSGSGFIVDRDGVIFTNAHVVRGASSLTVHLADGRRFPAETIGSDPETDVAVIRVRADSPLPTVPLGDSERLSIGDWVAAIGNPLGVFEGSLTVGVVSAKGRNEVSIRGGTPTYQDFIQTDASINFGNSGGPLVNRRGEAIGINTAFSGPGNGIGFAIPINLAREIAASLVSTGRVVRGYLGVVLQEIDPDLAAGLKLPAGKGALVREVQPSTPAAAAGLRAGDVIVRFDGHEVSDVAGLRLQVARTPVGRRVSLSLLRFGQDVKADVELAERPSDQADAGVETATPHPAPTKLGIEVSPAPSDGLAEGHGVLVDQVASDGIAADAGIRSGDLVLEVDGEPVSARGDFDRAIRRAHDESRPAVLRLGRGVARWFLALPSDKLIP
ncbi:MAG: trypsin-like peptidase domain-containing protein [Candidatus Eisenbacteria bacterium]